MSFALFLGHAKEAQAPVYCAIPWVCDEVFTNYPWSQLKDHSSVASYICAFNTRSVWLLNILTSKQRALRH